MLQMHFRQNVLAITHTSNYSPFMRPWARYVRRRIFGARFTWMCSITRWSQSKPYIALTCCWESHNNYSVVKYSTVTTVIDTFAQPAHFPYSPLHKQEIS